MSTTTLLKTIAKQLMGEAEEIQNIQEAANRLVRLTSEYMMVIVQNTKAWSDEQSRSDTGYEHAVSEAKELLTDRQTERLLLMCFDENGKKLAPVMHLSQGTEYSVPFGPREKRAIVAEIKRVNAAGIMLFHNHPSGYATASQADREANNDMLMIARLLNFKLIDHVIISKYCTYSMKQADVI